MTTNHGMRLEIVATPGRPQCGEVSPFPRSSTTHDPRDRCVYVDGHDGLHYADWVAWGTGDRYAEDINRPPRP
jgi:hypothetical protein